MSLEFSKEKQLSYKNKKEKKAGSKTEAPVQNFIDSYLKQMCLDNFRVPDSIWRFIHNPFNKIKIQYKKIFSDSLAGWSDNTIYYPITNKYSLTLHLEAKSRTGKLNGNKQRNMAKRLSYQIPRSPEQAKTMIDEFMKDAEIIKSILENNKK